MSEETIKRGRGRPKGSKNKPKVKPTNHGAYDPAADWGDLMKSKFFMVKCAYPGCGIYIKDGCSSHPDADILLIKSIVYQIPKQYYRPNNTIEVIKWNAPNAGSRFIWAR